MTEVRTWGEGGPHVVLVHGAGMSAGVWVRVGPALASQGYRVSAPNLCGYGQTPTPDGFSVADDVELVASLCDEDTHLFGHSYGGYVALQVARRGVVARLSAYEPVAFSLLGDDVSDAHKRLAADPRFSDPATGGDETWLRAFVNFWMGPGGWDALPAKARARQIEDGPRAFANVMAVRAAPVPLAAYAEITAPTTIMHGQHTPVDARRICGMLVDTIPDARGVAIPGAGHMGPVSHPREFLSALTDQFI